MTQDNEFPADAPLPAIPPPAREPEPFHDEDWTIVGNPAPLFAALARAQAKFETIHKDRVAQVRSDKGNYSYGYATLGETLNSVTEALNAEGLAFSQPTSVASGRVRMRTVIAHASGAFMFTVSAFSGVAEGADSRGWQALGKAITYARRYAGQAMLGVAPSDDDDANEADGKDATVAPRPAPQTRQQPPAAPKPQPKPAPKAPEPPKEEPKAKPQVFAAPMAPKVEKEPELPAPPAPPKPATVPPPPKTPVPPPPADLGPAAPKPLTPATRSSIAKKAREKGCDAHGAYMFCYQHTNRPECYEPAHMTEEEGQALVLALHNMTPAEVKEHCQAVAGIMPPGWTRDASGKAVYGGAQ